MSVTTWDTISHKILLPCIFNVEELLSALHEKSQTIKCAACHICKLQQSSMEVWTVTANGIGKNYFFLFLLSIFIDMVLPKWHKLTHFPSRDPYNTHGY